MENKKIKAVSLCFENIEVVELAYEMLSCLELKDIKTNMSKGWYSAYIRETEIAESAMFVINPAGNMGLISSCSTKLFDRITSFNDLVSIDLIYEDDTFREITFNWGGDSFYKNEYQSTCITDKGYLIVCIDEKHKAEEYKKKIENAK